jgi:CHASE2 domain-containing sensor protein
MRGRVAPPEDIVIIAIDDFSIQQGTENYSRDVTEQLDYLQPLHSWPWERAVYATVIKKLLDSGATSVGVDLIFDNPSQLKENDEQFHQVLKDYEGKITLAALYEEEKANRLGDFIRLVKPSNNLTSENTTIGTINYLIEADGRIHQFPNQYIKKWSEDNPDLAETLRIYRDFTILSRSYLKSRRDSHQ